MARFLRLIPFVRLSPKSVKQWLRSGESAHLPPMWPGFKSRRRRHMWVDFVAGSLPCSKRFFSGYSGFPFSSKTRPTFSNSNSTRNQVDEEPLCECATSKSLFILFIYLYHWFIHVKLIIWRQNNGKLRLEKLAPHLINGAEINAT